MRGQANLVALAVALLALTTATGVGLALADGALADADRDADERRVAVALSERLVSTEAPLTSRANVVNDSAVSALNASTLRTRYPVVGDRAVRVRLDDRTLAATGDSTSGTTVRRIVLVERRQRATVAPPLAAESNHTVTLPRRTPRVTVTVDPPPGTTVTAMRANDRVVLYDESGLGGEYTVRVSRFDTVRLRFEADRSLPAGSVEITYYPAETTKATLAVTVDD